MKRFYTMLLVALGLAAGVAVGHAQDKYPSKPVKILVPYAPGGATDIVARIVGEHLRELLGQSFYVENKPGAYGILAIEDMARAKPDGYTLMVGHSGVFAIAPALYANPGYDPRHDFTPIGLIGSFQQVLVVHPLLPIHSISELIAVAKEQPGKITYASAGVGSGGHLSTELLADMAGIKLTHVPYRGTGAA